jgi:DNA-binding GntR family transcriptional regulator
MPHIRRLDLLHFDSLTREDGAAADHAAILDACRRGDAWEAARLVEANFLRLGEQMTALLVSDP